MFGVLMLILGFQLISLGLLGEMIAYQSQKRDASPFNE
jgi:hypothetical protein